MPPSNKNARTGRARRRLRDLASRLLRGQHRHESRQRSREGSSALRNADRALLVVDVQNDFVTGVLPVPAAARIIPTLNRYMALFAERDLPVYVARDWHPSGETHAASSGGDLPAHCVQGTPGAAAPSELEIPVGAIIIAKGTTPGEPGFSAFAGRHPGPVSLRESFESRGVRTVYVAGLGPGVPATVLEGARLGLDMVLLADAVRGIDGTSSRLRRAIEGMCRAGARVEQFDGVVRELVSAAPRS